MERIYKTLKTIFDLSLPLAKAEFKLRNEGSYAGILWYLLNPFFSFFLLFFIFNDRLGSDIKNYPLYLLVGIIMFNFFQNSTTEASKLIVLDHNHLIKSVNFPRESLVVSVVIKNIFSHLFEAILLLAGMLFFGISPVYFLLYFPVLVIFSLFILGLSFILSSAAVYFADLGNVWNFVSRIVWLATPIFYAIGGQTKLFYLNLLNPIFYFISIARNLIIHNSIPSSWLIFGAIGYSFAFFFIGIFLFSKLKSKFAEMI